MPQPNGFLESCQVQTHPGPGLLSEVVALLVLLCRQLQVDALS